MQLQIECEPIQNDLFEIAKIEFEKDKKIYNNVFLCYGKTTKEYFVSRYFSRNYIESFCKNVLIVK